MKARHAILVALAAAVTLTSVAAAGPEAAKRGYTFTENGVRFSFNVAPRPPGAFHPVKSISTDKLPGGPISLNKGVYGARMQRGSSIGRVSRTANTPIRVGVCCPRRLAHRPPDSRPQCRGRPAPSSSRGLRTSHWAGTPRSTWRSPFARTSGATLGSFTPGETRTAVRCTMTDAGDTIRVWIVTVNGTQFRLTATRAGQREAQEGDRARRNPPLIAKSRTVMREGQNVSVYRNTYTLKGKRGTMSIREGTEFVEVSNEKVARHQISPRVSASARGRSWAGAGDRTSKITGGGRSEPQGHPWLVQEEGFLTRP